MTTDPMNHNTYVFDPESPTEMARLINQDRMLTKGMGGVLPEVSDTSSLHNVLDIACGPGGWVLDFAFEHPEIEVAGIDISRTMIDYANARARTQHLTNASFGVMDIRQPLDFADGAFDLLNVRFLFAVLHRDAWPPFLQECKRLLRPGGILRLTEPVDLGTTSGPSTEYLSSLFYQILQRGGYSFSANGGTIGITHKLPQLLRNAGYLNIQNRAHALDFSVDAEAWGEIYHLLNVGYIQARPMLIKAGLITQEDFDRHFQQLHIETHLENFSGMWHYVTVSGTCPWHT